MSMVRYRTLLPLAATLACQEFIAEPGLPPTVPVQRIYPQVRSIREIVAGPVLSGVITDSANRKLMPGSLLKLMMIVSGREVLAAELLTGREGEFAFKPLPPGRYGLHVMAIGYERQRMIVTIMAAGPGAPVAIAMPIEPGCTLGEVIVERP